MVSKQTVSGESTEGCEESTCKGPEVKSRMKVRKARRLMNLRRIWVSMKEVVRKVACVGSFAPCKDFGFPSE